MEETKMRHHHKLILGALLLGAAAVSSAQSTGESADPKAKVSTLMTRDLPEAPGKELQMLKIEYGPGESSAIHRHDAHVLVYVIEGEVVMALKGGKEQTVRAGETYSEAPGDIHTVSRNPSATKPTKFIAFFFKDEGKPAVMPVE
jgi:quercetin dioxygenase-like cupin family protein